RHSPQSPHQTFCVITPLPPIPDPDAPPPSARCHSATGKKYLLPPDRSLPLTLPGYAPSSVNLSPPTPGRDGDFPCTDIIAALPQCGRNSSNQPKLWQLKCHFGVCRQRPIMQLFLL